LCAIRLPPLIGLAPEWGVAGLTSSAGIAGWVEFALLRRTLNHRIGNTGLPAALVGKLWTAAAVAAAAGWAAKYGLGMQHPREDGLAILAAYGLTYFAAAYLLRVEECASAIRRVSRL
jgi:putative peptidoglycan lipid II flippase